MGNRTKLIDAYIDKSADFAKPILKHLREVVHKACPTVEEKIKWGFPHFDYKGEMMCSMAAFKQHCVFGFWKGKLIKGLTPRGEAGAMGHLGRITSIRDLPSAKKLAAFVKEAMQLNEQGVKAASKPKAVSEKVLVIPEYFIKALSKNKKALQVFDDFAYSHKKEYVEWITEAKTEETRDRRIETAVEWIAEGKGRNWKYQKK
ncbi:YdeI/OmpD-associated family protein [Ferruginibacter albus]|uniref:YdeI/OmpD-associated family protein n=1 Tax=Ferruginibacter albus TaxID=2875540 RepID=UPI001CC6C2E0|nr:YdeI/OmpD-associated family protein [Ferruginibacter albus]UAY52453.1 YdeI/OmpD-associated family protein [Ferruginibacter albus]